MPLSRFNLTRREIQVLWLLAKGKMNKEIAAELCIAEKTVEFHLGKLFMKLGARTRVEAVILIARAGLLEKTRDISC
jgi:DNA-binding NarL/FixJ family response regulator